jgi:hypothetical protein
MIKFSSKQKALIEQGKSKRNSLLRAVRKSVNLNGEELHPHTYLYSNPGLGKTYNVTKEIQQSGKPYVVVSGAVSMFAFGLDLMSAHYAKKPGQTLFVIVDDCDAILDTNENLNIMKNVLSGNKVFQRRMAVPTGMLNEMQKQILPNYQNPLTTGYEVPTDEMVFIFASNHKLPTDDESRLAMDKKGLTNSTKKLISMNAIRSRCVTKDFSMDWETEWGWISEVVINDGGLSKMNEDQKILILDWMYNNWNNMTEHSIRTAEKMAQVMLDEGDEYRDAWEADFLK